MLLLSRGPQASMQQQTNKQTNSKGQQQQTERETTALLVRSKHGSIYSKPYFNLLKPSGGLSDIQQILKR